MIKAESSHPLTFPELSNSSYLSQLIEIRGFLYQDSQGNWILSSEPNLKTCCLGSKEKNHSQLFVEGKNLKLSSLAVTLRGTLNIKNGEKWLCDASALQVSPSYNWIFALLAFFLFSIVLVKKALKKAPHAS